MYVYFGQKWMKLHQGPLWNVAGSMQSSSVHVVQLSCCQLCIIVYLRVGQRASCTTWVSQVKQFMLYIFNSLLTPQTWVNTPLLSESTIRQDLVASGISLTSEIQVNDVLFAILPYYYLYLYTLKVSAIDEGARVHPDSWWWVKADGCDILSGLSESTHSKWSGNVDLNDGKSGNLQQLNQSRVDFVG